MSRVALPILLLTLACVPARGSSDWVARQYSEALLRADDVQMRQLLASDGVASALPRDQREGARHFVRLCPYGGDGDARREVLALVSGGLDKSAQGIRVVVVKEDAAWKVREAKLTRDSSGDPSWYFFDCSVRLNGPTTEDLAAYDLPPVERAERPEPPPTAKRAAPAPIVQPQPK
jgi:hypothetical protein